MPYQFMSQRFQSQYKSLHNFVGLLLLFGCAMLPTANAWTVVSKSPQKINKNTALEAWSLFSSADVSSTFSSPWYNEYNPTARAFVDYYDPAPTTSYSFVTVADDWPITVTSRPNHTTRRPRGNPIRRVLRRWALLKRIRRKAD